MTTTNNNNSNNNVRRRNGGARPNPPTKTRGAGGAGTRLLQVARGDLHDAGMDVFDYFETMINPEDYPPGRVPDAHAATSAVFKTPFVVDLPYSGVWNPDLGRSSAPDLANPRDGYSEVIIIPGTTDCYFHTLGSDQDVEIWRSQDDHPFEEILVPVLSTHPLNTDIVGGRTQLSQGLRTINTATLNVAVLPKLDSVGHFVMECVMQPFGTLQDDVVQLLFGFHNVEIHAPTRTMATVTLLWNNAAITAQTLPISSTGDNNTIHSDFYIFQFPLPEDNAIINSFYVEVSDLDPASRWKYSFTSAENNGSGFALRARSACAFQIVSAPEMGTLSETLSERTTALTALVTYMGSTLQDGGQISAARLGMGLSPLRAPNGDVYTYLASLPFYNDDFALRDGIYTWWLPDSIQEYFYCPYRNPRSDDLEFNATMQIAVLRDDPTQAVRLKIIQNLEVLTRSRLYTSVSGPNNPAYGTIVTAIKSVPAVTINHFHLGILGKALAAVKSWVSRPANFKKLLKGGAGLIQKIAPGSAPASIASSVMRRLL
jgi:hypothetical protein